MTLENGKHLSFPFCIGKDGRAAETRSLEDHVHDELIQLILTNPGERIFEPEFGSGIRRLVFQSIDETTVGVAKATITQAISRWLGSRITLENLSVTSEDNMIEVELKYRIAGTEDTRIMRFQRKGG
jgi:phage baseplate assembly protein W